MQRIFPQAINILIAVIQFLFSCKIRFVKKQKYGFTLNFLSHYFFPDETIFWFGLRIVDFDIEGPRLLDPCDINMKFITCRIRKETSS